MSGDTVVEADVVVVPPGFEVGVVVVPPFVEPEPLPGAGARRFVPPSIKNWPTTNGVLPPLLVYWSVMVWVPRFKPEIPKILRLY